MPSGSEPCIKYYFILGSCFAGTTCTLCHSLSSEPSRSVLDGLVRRVKDQVDEIRGADCVVGPRATIPGLRSESAAHGTGTNHLASTGTPASNGTPVVTCGPHIIPGLSTLENSSPGAIPSVSNRRQILPDKESVRIELSHDSTLANLLAADGVTICLHNNKNGHKNDDLFLDPVKSAGLVHSSRSCKIGAPLGSFPDENGRLQSVSADEIRSNIRQGVTLDNLAAYGLDLKRIGSHSSRSGGAMRLKLAGCDDDTIKNGSLVE
jgi:hypothetical protein